MSEECIDSVEKALIQIKKELEMTISTATFKGERKENGLKAKEALIRSSTLIDYIHEAVKHQLLHHGVKKEYLFPPLGVKRPELKLTGALKQKNQDICVKPGSIPHQPHKVTWGPMAFGNITDLYGPELTEKIISVNVRSQLSSLEKNFDTLFERTYAEALNLHEKHKRMCMGEVYLIPILEYDDELMKVNQIGFKKKPINLEKYIHSFSFISNRENEHDSTLKYERCALLIVDFSLPVPKMYSTTKELKEAGLVSETFDYDMRGLDFEHLAEDLLAVYDERHGLDLITK